jgi:hypothetical protein
MIVIEEVTTERLFGVLIIMQRERVKWARHLQKPEIRYIGFTTRASRDSWLQAYRNAVAALADALPI